MAARHVTEPEPASQPTSGRSSDDLPRISRSSAPIRHGWPGPPSPRASLEATGLEPPVRFDGSGGAYLRVSILALLITVLSLGLLFPSAYVVRLRWRIGHTLIEGRRMRFTGTGFGLFKTWLRCWALIVITLGVYGFWARPRLERWACDHTELAAVRG
jgi:uncharacterized membrane protein YjgN (DUF898 family)